MDSLEQLAALLRERNQIEKLISELIGRPATMGHIGEFIASAIFDIELMPLANNKAIDGYFRSGPLADRSVDVKFYGKQEGLLAIQEGIQPDFFLVMTGEPSAAASSKGKSRLCTIERVYLFEGKPLAQALRDGGLKFGVAASIRAEYWSSAEVYPTPRNGILAVSDEQRRLLQMFRGSSSPTCSPPKTPASP